MRVATSSWLMMMMTGGWCVQLWSSYRVTAERVSERTTLTYGLQHTVELTTTGQCKQRSKVNKASEVKSQTDLAPSSGISITSEPSTTTTQCSGMMPRPNNCMSCSWLASGRPIRVLSCSHVTTHTRQLCMQMISVSARADSVNI